MNARTAEHATAADGRSAPAADRRVRWATRASEAIGE